MLPCRLRGPLSFNDPLFLFQTPGVPNLELSEVPQFKLLLIDLLLHTTGECASHEPPPVPRSPAVGRPTGYELFPTVPCSVLVVSRCRSSYSFFFRSLVFLFRLAGRFWFRTGFLYPAAPRCGFETKKFRCSFGGCHRSFVASLLFILFRNGPGYVCYFVWPTPSPPRKATGVDL